MTWPPRRAGARSRVPSPWSSPCPARLPGPPARRASSRRLLAAARRRPLATALRHPRRPAPAQASRQRRDARRLHRLRLRPVPGPHARRRWTAGCSSSPFLAVGIYISGDSRACRNQPNLTPTWVSTQLASGWRLLPITLGPQASCQPRFPRYGDDETISPARGTNGTLRRPRASRASREADEGRRRRHGAGHRRRAARSGTTSRASTTPTPTAASRRWRSSAAGPSRSTRSATSPASTPAPAPASRCSTTPG